MAVKVYRTPEGIKLPDWRDYKNWRENEEKYIQQLRDWLEFNGYTDADDYAGKIVRFGVGDGYAQYMVIKLKGGCEVMHLELGDAWHYQHIERLLKKDLVANIKQQEAWAKIIATKG